jgi:molybdate-binding protein/DNA-binding XRE family transcriptional regulator
MKRSQSFQNDLRRQRDLRGWSQDELARQSGLSRAGISAIETGRLVPSAAAALAVAAALDCRVEDVFHLRDAVRSAPAWAWLPARVPCRFWQAEVGGACRLYPTEFTALGVIPHDGVASVRPRRAARGPAPDRTFVVASCDPAVGLLADALARAAGYRLIALPRASHAALALLGQGLVHAAGVHLAKAEQESGNLPFVLRELGTGYTLLRAARWEEGIAVSPHLRLSSVRAALGANLRWIGREPGSGARDCLDELLEDRPTPRRVASDHRSVAEAVRSGWADAGVCLRLVTEEAGVDFLPVRQEEYDLCFPTAWEGDPRFQALVQVVRSPAYRKALRELPGYNDIGCGALQRTG